MCSRTQLLRVKSGIRSGIYLSYPHGYCHLPNAKHNMCKVSISLKSSCLLGEGVILFVGEETGPEKI
jgi:hypothetical protein